MFEYNKKVKAPMPDYITMEWNEYVCPDFCEVEISGTTYRVIEFKAKIDQNFCGDRTWVIKFVKVNK